MRKKEYKWMRRLYRWFLPGCVGLISCVADHAPYTTEDDGLLLLDFSPAETRANLDADGAGSFSENDRIGLYIVHDGKSTYRELTYQNGQWMPRLIRSEFGEGSLNIAAHYPPLPETDTPESYPFTQTGTTADSDLLFASASVPAGSYRASLAFHHLFHRLELNLTGATDNVQVAVRTRTEGTLNLLTGEAAVNPGADFRWTVPATAGNGHYHTLIYPQPAAPYRGEEGLVKLTANGKETSVQAPERMDNGQALVNFEAGKQVRINLNVSQQSSQLAGKTLWVYGVSAPDFPGKAGLPSLSPGTETFTEGAWFRQNWTFSEDQYLTWKEGCGWYDCNKSKGYTEGDANLCWAASASNLLIWWMVNNRPYLEAYDAQYGSSVTVSSSPQELERPQATFKPLYYKDGSVNRAPVFEFFKAHFPDRVSWSRSGVNWFLTGNPKDLQSSPDIQNFPGFFHKVFGPEDDIATDSKRHPQPDEFNAFVADALLNRKALGINVLDIAGKGTGNHALVIWGAEFDMQGHVSYLYYCDNNNADQDVNGAVIKRIQVAYLEDNSTPETAGKLYAYLKRLDAEDGTVGQAFKITGLCAVDLRRDIWARKYPHISVEK